MVFGLISKLALGAYLCKVQSVCFVTFYSVAAILSNVPYMFPIFTTLVGKKSSLVRIRQFCKDRTLERLRMGAKRKDLFYYLVGSHTHFLVSSSHRMQ